MASFVVHAERTEPQRYWYRVSRFEFELNEQKTLMAGDVFKFTIRVYMNMNTSPSTLLLYSPSQIIPCHTFLQDGQILWTFLSRLNFFIESLEGITEAVISDVRELFNVDGLASSSPSPSLESQRREIPLWLEITLFDTGLLLATDESLQCFRMIPASNEAIHTSLKKSKVVEKDKCFCPICLDDLVANAECCTMPCDHLFHQQCIVSWLKINHVCPVCRYSLPTLKD